MPATDAQLVKLRDEIEALFADLVPEPVPAPVPDPMPRDGPSVEVVNEDGIPVTAPVEVGTVVRAKVTAITGPNFEWINEGVVRPETSDTYQTQAWDTGTAQSLETVIVKVTGRDPDGNSVTVASAPFRVVPAGGLPTPTPTPTPTPVPSGTLAALVKKDMTLAAEAPVYLDPGIDWYSNPRYSGFDKVTSGEARYIQPWNAIVQMPSANTVAVPVIFRDLQCWGLFADGAWVRLGYSVGHTWWSTEHVNWDGVASSSSNLGAPVGGSGGGGSPSVVTLGAGVNPSDQILHGAGAGFQTDASGARGYANIRRLLFAFRAAIQTPNANAHYGACMAADKKSASTNYYDMCIGRVKRVPTDGTYRVFTAQAMAGTQAWDTTYPALTGAQASELY